MAERTDLPIYQVHLWIRQIGPMIWRRVLVRRESTLAQFHDVIQIVFGWSDAHLHHYRIHGRDYGVSRDGGPWFSQDACQVHLADFQSRSNERFLYEYDFGDCWQHEVRIERGLEEQRKRTYPVCIGRAGRRGLAVSRIGEGPLREVKKDGGPAHRVVVEDPGFDVRQGRCGRWCSNRSGRGTRRR
jgi:hypothetical protein